MGVHEHRLRVRYGETDQMGRVHHANYLLYLEEGRTRMMAEAGCSYAELERTGIGLPVRKAELRYRAPAAYEDVLVVRTRIAGMRTASITFAYEIVREDDGGLVAHASVELACIDMRADPPGPVALPKSLREALEAAAAEPEPEPA